ncbi:hypothetical protein Pla108_15090 [Botrimarina colliarenosi]|uniref:DUF2442 domain-containing protein n=1 Tax=Botrimarina colliarenosi TaxID=2528001 RepID=A0A5C6AM56_9BACT|nr:DUF2442 domain-containing protein [Botrimarina colliarenosi]TWU00557.1 hypothetical protein Pla108_15090 [Botrimarina colliarenosi]
MARIVEVKPVGGTRLGLRFADGVVGEVDLHRLVGKGVFAPMADPSRFAEVKIGEDGELRWDDTIDLCPDALYMEVTGKSMQEAFADTASKNADACH